MYAIERILEQEDWASLAQAFARQGYQPPVLKWGPQEVDIEAESLKHTFTRWNALRGGAGAPQCRAFAPESLHPYLGWATLLEPNADASDFRYRIYGTKLADLSGFDLNGKFVSQMPTPPIMKAFLLAGHRLVARRRRPLLSKHSPPATSNAASWTRLLLPLLNEEGETSRVLVMNVPDALRPPSIEHHARFYGTLVDM